MKINYCGMFLRTKKRKRVTKIRLDTVLGVQPTASLNECATKYNHGFRLHGPTIWAKPTGACSHYSPPKRTEPPTKNNSRNLVLYPFGEPSPHLGLRRV